MAKCIYKHEDGMQCKTYPVYNNFGETKGLYCALHKLEGMVDVKNINKVCKHPGCKTRSSYNNEGEKKGLYCALHRKDGMVNVTCKMCIHPECKTQAAYNIEGEKKGLYCYLHKKDGMVDVKHHHKTCIHPECKTLPSYNNEFETIPLYCSLHKKEGMVNIVSKPCIHAECKTLPIYNNPGEVTALYCALHKLEGMVDVKNINKVCKHPGCKTRSSYNNEGEKKGLYCALHKKDGMVDIAHKICIHSECKTRAAYNIESEKKGLYCYLHKKDGMVDVAHKTCNSKFCYTRPIKKYDGYCMYCYMNLFPDKPVARNYKTKERAVVEFIISNFPHFTWVADKVISDGCSKRRPDLMLDLGYQVNIVEVDENRHDGYDCSCENKRIMELSQDVGHRPIVIIRFNPDGYTDQTGKNIASCWSQDGNGICVVKKSKKSEWESRLQQLKDQLQYWSEPIHQTNKTIEVVQLFYDMNL